MQNFLKVSLLEELLKEFLQKFIGDSVEELFEHPVQEFPEIFSLSMNGWFFIETFREISASVLGRIIPGGCF